MSGVECNECRRFSSGSLSPALNTRHPALLLPSFCISNSRLFPFRKKKRGIRPVRCTEPSPDETPLNPPWSRPRCQSFRMSSSSLKKTRRTLQRGGGWRRDPFPAHTATNQSTGRRFTDGSRCAPKKPSARVPLQSPSTQPIRT